jgi:EAL and modified HD-GYP domain-containing signal transduction protein
MFAYVARQAIYDTQKNVFGYELLFRDGVKNCFPDISPDEATSNMLAASHLSVGVESITFNKPAFINFHTDTLIYRFPSTLNPENVVIEIVETVEVTKELVTACAHINELGYKMALDDYDFSEHWETLMPYIHFIKFEVEVIDLDNPVIVKKLKQFADEGKVLIAERVETHEEFEKFKAAGFHYFQGYFLSKPEVVKHKNIDVSMTSVIELLRISVSTEVDVAKITEIFEKDVGLTFKLMRFINNPSVNKRNKIESLSHALKFLGHVELKKFIALLTLANLKGNKPEDLLLSSLTRAQFCKLVNTKMGQSEDPPNSFILGLFSRTDALLDMPMEQVLEKLPFSEIITDVLCQRDLDDELAQQFQLCIAFETANWAKIDEFAKLINTSNEELFAMYYEATSWANQMKSSL